MAAMCLTDFSNKDFLGWIRANVAGQGKPKQDLIKVMEAQCVTGQYLVELTGFEDLAEFDGVTRIMARRVMRGLQTQYPNEFDSHARVRAKQAKAKAEPGTATHLAALLASNELKYPKQPKPDEFQVTLFIGNKRILSRDKFRVTSTILDLSKYICQEETGCGPEKIRLVHRGKPLSDNDTFQKAGIVDSQCFVVVLLRVLGGAALPRQPTLQGDLDDDHKSENKANETLLDSCLKSTIRERLPHFKTNQNISASLEEDCVTLDDDSNELRVKMPCGHVFAPLTIFSWCQRTLERATQSQVCCPILECGKEWKIADIVSAADLDEDEHASLSNTLTRRQLLADGHCQECPSCRELVQFPETEYSCRVRCMSKDCPSKKDFCWLCTKEWKGNGISICGNKDCCSAKVNDILKIENCGTTTAVTGRADVVLPKRRACPRCLSITEAVSRSKYMICWNCKELFCFVCLTLSGKSPMNGHGREWACSGQCKVAPVQVLS